MSFVIGLEVTKRCNFKCTHCMVDAGRPHADEMDTAAMTELVRALVDCGVTELAWSGGEPLLRKDLVELSRFGQQLGLTYGLATNGYLADEQTLVPLRDAGLRVVQISLDGVNAEKAHRYRKGPRDAFDRAIRAVKDSVALGIKTYVCTLLSPETACEITEMVDLTLELDAHGLRYTMWAPNGRAGDEQYDEAAWSHESVGRFFDIAAKVKKAGFKLLIDCPSGPYPGAEVFRCNAGHHTAYITAHGDLYPCTALMRPEYLVGNVRKEPVADLLFGPRVPKILREMATTLPAGSCSGCEQLIRCRGGCPGRTLAAFGQLRGGAHQGGMPVCLWRLHPQALSPSAE